MQQTNQPGGPGQGAYPPPNPNQPPYSGQSPNPNQPPPYPAYPPPGIVPAKKRGGIRGLIIGIIAVVVIVISLIVIIGLTIPAGPAAITKAVMAKDFQNKAAVNETTVFASNDPKLVCVINLDNPKTTTKIKGTWYVVSAGEYQNQQIGETEITTSGGENIIYLSFIPKTTLPAGSYKIDISLDGTLNRTLNFTVQ